MIRQILTLTVGGAMWMLPAHLVAGNINNPVQVLDTFIPSANGIQEIPVSSTDLRTAVSVEVRADTKQPVTNVARKMNQQAAVYAGVAKTSPQTTAPPQPATFGAPADATKYVFKVNGDSGQAWATMNANGMPYLYTNSFGLAGAAGTASFKAKVAIPNGYPNLYVQLTIPEASLNGATEQDGPARWQAKFSAELLMNGHPVWESEAIRGSILNPAGVFPPEKGNWTSLYGSPVLVNDASAQTNKVVTIALGAFTAGQTVELTFVTRADTAVLNKCVVKKDPEDGVYKPFCTRATATLSWENAATPVRFFVGK